MSFSTFVLIITFMQGCRKISLYKIFNNQNYTAMKKKLNNLTAAVLFALMCGLIPTNAFSQVTELFSMIYDRFSPTSSEHARPYFVKMDGSGNVYVIGDDLDNNILVIKYNSAGAKLWQKQIPSWGAPESAELDNEGNLFIVYDNFPYSETFWITLIKITPSGIAAWSTSYPNSYLSGANDKKNFMSIGNSGIYVLARTVAPADYDYVTLKFSYSGALLWQKIYDSSTPTLISWDVPCGITIDNNENIYVTGKGADTGITPYGIHNFTTLKYNSSGTLLWSSKFARDPWNINSIAADNSGNVYIAGAAGGFFTVIKYNSSGTYQWAKYLKGSNTYTFLNTAKKILIDPAGNPTVSGILHDSIGALTTIKYTPGGSQIWMRKYDDYYSSFCNFTFINSTDILIAGKVIGHGLSDDIVLLKYDNNGILKWKKYYVSPYGDLEPVDLDARYDPVYGKTFFYVTSEVTPPDHGYDMLTAKFEEVDQPRPPAVNNETPAKYELMQNYPNPFNPQTKISFSIKKAGNVKLAVYDALGREISVLTNGLLEAGLYNVDFDASHFSSGVYFYKLESESFTDIKKMMLIK